MPRVGGAEGEVLAVQVEMPALGVVEDVAVGGTVGLSDDVAARVAAHPLLVFVVLPGTKYDDLGVGERPRLSRRLRRLRCGDDRGDRVARGLGGFDDDGVSGGAAQQRLRDGTRRRDLTV